MATARMPVHAPVISGNFLAGLRGDSAIEPRTGQPPNQAKHRRWYAGVIVANARGMARAVWGRGKVAAALSLAWQWSPQGVLITDPRGGGECMTAAAALSYFFNAPH